MSRALDWSALAIHDLQGIHWRAASQIDEALQYFAASGEGSIRYVTIDGERALRLYVAPYFAWISLTPDSIIVWRVLRYA